MGNQNGYFQLIRDDKGMNIKLFKAEEGGENITLDEIVKYLEKNHIIKVKTACCDPQQAVSVLRETLREFQRRGAAPVTPPTPFEKGGWTP